MVLHIPMSADMGNVFVWFLEQIKWKITEFKTLGKSREDYGVGMCLCLHENEPMHVELAESRILCGCCKWHHGEGSTTVVMT